MEQRIYVTIEEITACGIYKGHSGYNPKYPDKKGWGLKILPLLLKKGLTDSGKYGHKNHGLNPQLTWCKNTRDKDDNLLGITFTQYTKERTWNMQTLAFA